MIFKCHKLIWLFYSITTPIVILVCLITSAIIKKWDITYSVLALSPFVALSWIIKFYNEQALEKIVSDSKTAKRAMRTSIAWSMLSMLILMIPIIVVIAVNFAYNMLFNLYSFFILFLIYFVGFYICRFIEIKKINKDKKDSKETLCH